MAGTLFIVSTPIGNLGDITYRAVELLRACDCILAEDTRHSRVLLDRYDIHTPTHAFHAHNEDGAVSRVLERLERGEQVALISDAGTPILSDPGVRLVSAAIEAGHAVVPIPGASALLAALVVSGLRADRFAFLGFLPRRKRRNAALAGVAALPLTAVLYEAPVRVARTLADLVAAGIGDRRAVVARELTKKFEEVRRGTVADLAAYYEANPPRGEVVIIIEAGRPLPDAEGEDGEGEGEGDHE